MAPILQSIARDSYISQVSKTKEVLLQKLDEAIDDMEQGRIQTIEEAWNEIDAV